MTASLCSFLRESLGSILDLFRISDLDPFMYRVSCIRYKQAVAQIKIPLSSL